MPASTLDKLTVFNYTEMGANLLKTVSTFSATSWKDEKFKANMVKFVRASMKGWAYARRIPKKQPASFSTTTPPARRRRNTRST